VVHAAEGQEPSALLHALRSERGAGTPREGLPECDAYTKDFQVHMCGHLPALDTRLLPTERAELHPVADVRWGSQRRCSHAWACPQAQDASV